MKKTISHAKAARAVGYVPPVAESFNLEVENSVMLTISTKDVEEQDMGW